MAEKKPVNLMAIKYPLVTPTTPAPPAWTLASDKSTTDYIDKILGIEGGGKVDAIGTHTDGSLKTTADALRKYSETYGYCSEQDLANTWYLKNKLDGVSKATQAKVDTVLSSKSIPRNKKIDKAYDTLKKELESTKNKTPKQIEDDKKKLEEIAKDREEIDSSFDKKTNSPQAVCNKCPPNKTACPNTAREVCTIDSKDEQAFWDKLNAEHDTCVNFNFLSNEEKTSLEPYVPPGDKSGVTIGTGVDLGHESAKNLENSGLPTPLVDKLKGLCGHIGRDAACAALKKEGNFVLSKEEVQALDNYAVGKRIGEVKDMWGRKPSVDLADCDVDENGDIIPGDNQPEPYVPLGLGQGKNFEDMDCATQTVFFFRYFHDGPAGMSRNNPADFIDNLKNGELEKVQKSLENRAANLEKKADPAKNSFKGQAARIKREADYIKDYLQTQKAQSTTKP